MIVRNKATGAMSIPTETKRVDLGWFEKCDDSQNELLYPEELLAIDRALQECDNILSEVNLQIGYKSQARKIYENAEKRQHLWNFIRALPDYIEAHLDEPLRQSLNHGACETISRIHMKDFTVENTLGLTISPYNKDYMGQPQHKDRLSLEDFIGNALGDEAVGNAIPGRNRECVEEFSAIFASQYDNMLALGILEDETALETYLDQFAVEGEYDHKEDQPFHLTLVSNLLDLTIIKPIIESCCGYDLITKEDLTEMEQNLKLAGALVDLITLATGLYGFASAGKNLGMKQMARLAMVELTADITATTVATIGEYQNWPPGLTLLLSLGAGITVGQIGNHIIFKKDGVEIFRKEITESATDVHHEINEEEIFYDDIFEQQRRVDLEYEDYLEELRQLQNESDIVFEGGTTTLNDWVNKTSDLSKQAPIEIPSSATVKIQAKNGYDQITFKWTENGQNYEVRWHTKTPGAPEGQGNTWVVSRVTPGTPTGQARTEHILVGDTWISRYQWQDAINAYRNGTATTEQLQLLKDGHWKAP